MKSTTSRLFVCGLAATLSLTLAPPAAHAKGGAASGNEIVVKLEDAADITAFANRWNVRVVDTMLSSRSIYLLEVSSDTSGKKGSGKGQDPKKISESMARDGDVDYAEPNYDLELSDGRVHYWEEETQTAPGQTPQSYAAQPAAQALRLTEAHRSTRGEGTKIAILDTGVNGSHPALAGRVQPGYDYVDDDADPSDSADGIDSNGNGHVDEGQGHGTAVAGLAHLVAPDATIIASRVLDSDGNGSVYILAEAISDAVTAGADVINISAGVEDDKTSKVLSEALKDAAKNQGVSVVVAAGNNGNGSKTYPASEKEVISVGSTEANDQTRLARFSNHGKWVKVAAPGVDLVTAGIGSYQQGSGTSLSAPLVAGEVALLRAERPSAKSKDILKAVAETSVPLRSGPKVERGSIDIVAALNKFR